MEKQFTFTFSGDEYNKLLYDKDLLRKQLKEQNQTIKELEEKIEYMKTEKEDVLVIVKDKEKADEYVIKTKEKEVLKELIIMNKDLVEKNEEYVRQLYNINDNLKSSLRKIEELEAICLKQSDKIDECKENIEYLEKRKLIERILNKKYIQEKDED